MAWPALWHTVNCKPYPITTSWYHKPEVSLGLQPTQVLPARSQALHPEPHCMQSYSTQPPLYLFWYITVGSFNLHNRLREDFIQWGESNHHFICSQLPSQGLQLSKPEGPGSMRTCLDGLGRQVHASNKSICRCSRFSASFQSHLSPPSCSRFYLTVYNPHEENNWI